MNLGGQHTLHGGLDLVDGVVDDPVHPHIHIDRAAVSLALSSGRTLKPTMMALEVEASITSLSLMAPTAQWMTRTRTSSLDSFSRDAFTASAGALNVCLDDDVQILHLARLDLAEQILQADLLLAGADAAVLLVLALLHQLTGHALVGHGVEVIARAGHLAHADDLHRHGGARRLGPSRPGRWSWRGPAHGGTGDDHIALMQGCRSAPAGWPRGRGPCPAWPR